MIKSLKTFELRGKVVLIRADFNVPMVGEKIMSNLRIKAVIPTIMTCLDAGSSVVLMSHMGRPKGSFDKKLSLIPVGEELASLLEMPIKFSNDCVSRDAIDTSISLKSGEIHLLENLRFHNGEEENDAQFSSQLSKHGQIYINDAFGTAHRSHASNIGIVSHFKNAGIGWLMNKELTSLGQLMSKPKTPLSLILGGAKVNTKLALISEFIKKADNIIIGGGMAFTFLKAQGKNIGGSLYDGSMLNIAKSIMNDARANGVKIMLPTDLICSESINGNRRVENYHINDIPDDMFGLDIGPKTINRFNAILKTSNTVLWNGPMGVFENMLFESGTKEVLICLKDIAKEGSNVIVGGGDTAAAVEKFGFMDEMSHVSTGGGASLEFLSGNSLPAVNILDR